MRKRKKYQWDAESYASHSNTQQTMARKLIAKLDLKGDESLLDIGCGDGKVTVEIADLLPAGRVIGLDSSEEMIEHAKSRYPLSDYPNVSFQQGDASRLYFDQVFNVVFSNAALHWIIDHRPILHGIFSALTPGGRVFAQTGARGNASDVIDVAQGIIRGESWRSYFEDFSFPYGFYSIQEYKPWLKEAGFQNLNIEIAEDRRVHLDTSSFKGWIRTTWQPYLLRIPEELRETFIEHLVTAYLQEYSITQDGSIRTIQKVLTIEAARPYPR